MERIASENIVKLPRENYVVWHEKFETIALQYGEAERTWKTETSYERGKPAPDDEIYDGLSWEYKDKVFLWDYDLWKRDVKEFEWRIKPYVVR
jgi:hypothetical protein